MAFTIRQPCYTVLHGLATLFISTLLWTLCMTSVSASEPNEVRAWFELHSIPQTELQQHRDWSSASSLGRDSTIASLTDSSSSSGDERETIWKPVSPGSGIGDNVATVGRVFKYAIPEGAFRGDISHYEITEAGRQTLPNWMFYTDKTRTLEGVPSETNMDQYYITVTAYGRETNGSVSQASDVFSVSVVPDSSNPSDNTAATPVRNTPSRGVKCVDDDPAVTATIVLDANWDKLQADRRMDSISKMSQYSRLGLEKFRLLPSSSKSLLDTSVLIAGPGNVRRAEHPGISLSWQIGCGTNANKFPVVTILESAAKDGSMASKLGHNIIGWHVTNDRPKMKRVRRQARLMGTPVPTPTPSDMPPKPTAVIPSTRIVPTDASPSIMPSVPMYTPSMIATIMPTRVMPPVDETTMGMPTTMDIRPTPMPPMKNSEPKIDIPIVRIEAVEWQAFSYRIPANTFIDAEDGNTRSLFLTLLDHDTGKELSKKSWVQFNKATQTMQGLPLEVSRNSYVLAAQDRQGALVRLVFELRVRAAPPASANPPPVTMGMSLDLDFDDFMNSPTMQLEILNNIASVFGDPDASAITFTNIKRGSVILSWTNNTLPTDECQFELIKAIMAKLVGPDGKPTQELIDAFDPLEITGVQAEATGPCSSTSYANPPMTTTQTLPGAGGSTGGGNLTRIIIIVIVIATLFILLIVGIILCLHCRRNRKTKLSLEDQKTFSNKGIPIIFSEEMEDPEKPQSSSTPLIMREEKPPLPPPQYSEDPRQPRVKDKNRANMGGNRNANANKRQNVPMIELSGSPPYKPPPAPLATSTPDSRNARPGNKTKYRAPPAYVPP